MRTEVIATFWVKLYISGPIAVAEQVLRAECMREGLCVTIEPTKFIYTGGEEGGYVVGVINYPRFPSTPEALIERTRNIAKAILFATHQHSALIQTPDITEWISNRPETCK